MDVELREVRDFLAAHPPYNALPARVLDGLPAKLHLRYFRRGTVIVDLGSANNSLFILRSGAVDIYRHGQDLVERADPGTTFGTSSVRSQQPSLYRIVAIEDSLVLVMPGEVFTELSSTQPAVAEYLGAGAADAMKRAVAELEGDATGRIILKTRVGDLIAREPITAPASITIRQAAQLMGEHRVSALLIVTEGRIAGIVTDRDLRNKVVAAQVSREEPITAIMTTSPMTIPSTALAVEAMLEMLSHGVHHLPIVDDHRLVGLVSSGDLMRLETANPIFLVGDIAKQPTAEGLAKVTSRLPTLVAKLVEQDASADEIHRLVTGVSDATIRRLLRLAEAELGPPPVPYEWLVLGSQGRHEHSLGSDQDHVLLLDDAFVPDQDGYFAALAESVTAGLEGCGYPRCSGEVMATNPRWRQTLHAWHGDFQHWISEPEASAILRAQIFFDFRSVHGGSDRADLLRDTIRTLAPRSPRFLGHLAAQAVERQPPIGFFRNLVLERGGGPQAGFDVKSAVHCVVELARVQALASAVSAVNTIERLHGVTALGDMAAESESALLDAFELITYVRVRHQARQVNAGANPTTLIAPDELSSLEKKHLRDAFGIIRRVQQGFAYRYQTHLMS